MDDQVSAQVRELVEARAIEQLCIRYLDRIDANDPAGAAACFARDGVGVYWGDYQGREAIADRLAGILDGFSATSHHISNIAPVIDGDRATCQSYVYAFHRRAESNEPFHYWGRWVWTSWSRRAGRWRFARRGVGASAATRRRRPRRPAPPGPPGRLNRSADA